MTGSHPAWLAFRQRKEGGYTRWLFKVPCLMGVCECLATAPVLVVRLFHLHPKKPRMRGMVHPANPLEFDTVSDLVFPGFCVVVELCRPGMGPGAGGKVSGGTVVYDKASHRHHVSKWFARWLQNIWWWKMAGAGGWTASHEENG